MKYLFLILYFAALSAIEAKKMDSIMWQRYVEIGELAEIADTGTMGQLNPSAELLAMLQSGGNLTMSE